MDKEYKNLIDSLEHIINRLDERVESTITLELKTYIAEWQNAESTTLETFESQWRSFAKQIILKPEFFFFVFREVVNSDADVFEAIKAQHYQQQLSNITGQNNGDLDWVQFQSDATNSETMLHQIIDIIKNRPFTEGKPFEVFSTYFSFIDLMYSHLVIPSLIPLHQKIFSLLYQQTLNWTPSYCDGYAYQGLAKLGISGVKPTEIRLSRYDIDKFINKNDCLLDIGSNNGFLAIHYAEQCSQVDALEYNPYLCQLGKAAAEHLSVDNVNFICDDFYLYSTEKKYNAVFSLANHATIDRKLSINFEEYLQKIYCMLDTNGYLFFESHDVFGHGTGNPGDDGDLDLKLDIASQYFETIGFKMTKKFVPCDDIDKLFIIFKRRDEISPKNSRTFSREEAIKKY